jgi:hypothetical protein
MAQPPIYEIDADGNIPTDALHWEGFPRILWETLSEGGLRYAASVRGGLFLGPGCSLRPHDRYRAAPPRAPRVGGLELDVLCSPRCRVG